MRPRLIPVLTLEDGYVVKTRKFKKPVYVGDPINSVKIFNEKEVDEITVLDIRATVSGSGPDFAHIEQIASECFMPMSYGGGIRTVEEIRKLFRLGSEKVILNSAALEDPGLVRAAAEESGSQSVVVSIDFRKTRRGYAVYSRSGEQRWPETPVEVAQRMADLGAGELLLNNIDRDGTRTGYDTPLVKEVASAVGIPVVACGGAGGLEDFREVIRSGGASAAAAGSTFVFHGKHSAVLIQYPKQSEIVQLFEHAS